MWIDIQQTLPEVGRKVEVAYLKGTDPVMKVEQVTWSDELLYDWHVTKYRYID